MSRQIETLRAKGVGVENALQKDFKLGSSSFKNWSDEVKLYLESAGYSDSIKGQIHSILNVQENPFNVDESKTILQSAISRVIHILDTLPKRSVSVLDKASAILVVESIICNFYKYYEEMFKVKPHGSGTLNLASSSQVK